MDHNPNQHDEQDDRVASGDLLIGASAIASYLIELGWPPDTDEDDVYYQKRAGNLPIGSTSPDGGGKLIASKRRLSNHTAKQARGPTAA